MSLTAAVSDDEDFNLYKPLLQDQSQGNVAFNCTGAVRTAGYLHVKKWILRKKHRIELAKKRGWKGYWVCLKGTTLLFYPCESNECRSIEKSPKHLIIVDGAIMQAIPEHPKRQHIFCLSTAFGDAYLFQAGSDSELNSWISNIHTACAAAFARHRGKAGTLHLLQEDTVRVENSIESLSQESNLKSISDMQTNISQNKRPKENVSAEISHLDESLERLHCERYRLKCYMASLQNSELPNPKMLLTRVSRATKLRLSRLGVFAVSSLHAHVCAHSPSLLQNLLTGRGAAKCRGPVLPPADRAGTESPAIGAHQSSTGPRRSIRVKLPAQSTVSVPLRDNMTVDEFLTSACLRKALQPSEHFIILRKSNDPESEITPLRSAAIQSYLQNYNICEVLAKQMFQTELTRMHLGQLWGFSVEAELVENENRQDELCCYISRVEEGSTAFSYGLISGDEMLVINGAIVADLDMMYIESLLQEQLTLCIMARTSRVQAPDRTCLEQTTDEMIQKLVCPPPPHDSSLSLQQADQMIVPPIEPCDGAKEPIYPHLKYTYATTGRTKVMQISERHIKDSSWERQKLSAPLSGENNVSPTNSASLDFNNSPMITMTKTDEIADDVIPYIETCQDGKTQESHSIKLLDPQETCETFANENSSAEHMNDDGSQSLQTKALSASIGNTSPPIALQNRLDANESSSGQVEISGHAMDSTNVSKSTKYLEENHVIAKQSSVVSNNTKQCSAEKVNHPPRDFINSSKDENLLSESVRTVRLSSENIVHELESDNPFPPLVEAQVTGSTEQSERKSSLTDIDKLKLQLTELITTERTYAQNLNSLMECYLTPLRSENIMNEQELDSLFGNIPNIVSFQREFLQCLEREIGSEESTIHLTSITQFKDILKSVADTFLEHSLNFKLYSAFCTSHSRAQKVLHQNGGNTLLQKFLQRQNPGQQHSSTLESYLIMPIQRLLKYPLLLHQLKTLVEKQSDELYHLEEALDAMEKIAEYINEVQRVHEEYGAIFDNLSRQYEKTCSSIVPINMIVDLSPGQLLHYGGVEWLNITDVLGKVKKGVDLHTMCFVFRTGVVVMCKERLKQKRRLTLSVSKHNTSEVEIVRYQALLPVTEVQLRTNEDKDSKPRFTWHLIHLKSQIHQRNERVYHFSNSDNEYRNSFMRSIRLIIRESVRTMSIPVSKVQAGGCRINATTMCRSLSVRRTSTSKVDDLHHRGHK